MTKRRRRQLTVRVEHEPNRHAPECLQQAYQVFSPTVAVSLDVPREADAAVSEDSPSDTDAVQPSRSPQ